MKTHLQLLLLGTSLLLGLDPARANVTMPAIFGDHMVLQQWATLPVWGKASPGEKVTVTVGTSTGNATTGTDGKWRVDLQPLKASKDPVTITVTGSNTLTFSDVLVGDVWVCSGQSNMEYGINSTTKAKEDIPKANRPMLRLFMVQKTFSFTPLDGIATGNNTNTTNDTLIGHWQVCTPQILVGHGGWPDSFSAVSYYFGSEIQERTGLPVGLIQTPWGGKPIQAFMSLESLKTDPDFAVYVAKHEKEFADSPALKAAAASKRAEYNAQMKAWNDQYGAAFKQSMEEFTRAENVAKAAHAPLPTRPKPPGAMPTPLPDGNPKPDTPTHLFNGMINTIIPYAMKGVIWYQGENNRDMPWDYDKLFAAMISDWRGRWGQGDFPFLFVQLASFQAPATQPVEKSAWAVIRDMQLRTLKVPNTAMAVAIDIGEATNIHPGDKVDVAHRLALAARKNVYGEQLESSGPLYDGMTVEGDKVRIRFQHAKGLKIAAHPQMYPDLVPTAPAELGAFAIAGADKNWVPAKAVIDGETMVVSSDQVKQPVAVRYGWANNPACNLYNGADLPASPFRTDNWQDAPSPIPAVKPRSTTTNPVSPAH